MLTTLQHGVRQTLLYTVLYSPNYQHTLSLVISNRLQVEFIISSCKQLKQALWSQLRYNYLFGFMWYVAQKKNTISPLSINKQHQETQLIVNHGHYLDTYFTTRVTLRLMSEGDVFEIDFPSSSVKTVFVFPASIK